MGCVHSDEPLGQPPVVSISFARKSTKKRRWGSRYAQKKASKQETNVDLDGASKEIPGLQPENQNIYQGKNSSNILRASLGSMEDLTVNHYSGRGEDIHRSSKFPGWGRYEKCTFCVTVGGIAGDKSTGGLGTVEKDPTQPVSLVETKEWLLDNREKSYPTALANLLALTALDLTAPASDALLKNRKNSWIQLAGHPGAFAPAGPNTIWKKRISKENYETKAYCALMRDPHMASAVPTFHREVEHNGEYFIEIEDLLQHFHDPNIMDIKMGKRTFLEMEVKNPVLRKDLYEKMVTLDPDAPTEEEREREAITKLRYMQFREQESSTADLGFRIEAVRMTGEPPNTNLKKVKTVEQISRVVTKFLQGNTQALSGVLQRLRDMKAKFDASSFLCHHEIIGSSILIMYDKDHKTGIWLIDFAKTIPVENGITLNHRDPWELGNHEDGFLSGLDNLIEILANVEAGLQPSASIDAEDS